MQQTAPRLAIVTSQWHRYLELITEASLPELVIVHAGEQLPADTTGITLLLADPGRVAGELVNLPRLRWLQSTFAGVDTLMAAVLRKDYLLTNVRGVFGPQMSEYVFGHLLALVGRHRRYAQQQLRGKWLAHGHDGLNGKQLLILGTGDIGRHLAITGKHFGMDVTGLSRSGKPVPGFDEVRPVAELQQALAGADVVVSVLPETPQTRGLLNRGSLGACKPGCVLVNVGRGSVLELDAVPDVLDAGQLGQLILDVFPQEPLPADHPLWQHPQVIITPHIAAQSLPHQVAAIFCDNYRLWLTGTPLKYRIDFAKGY